MAIEPRCPDHGTAKLTGCLGCQAYARAKARAWRANNPERARELKRRANNSPRSAPVSSSVRDASEARQRERDAVASSRAKPKWMPWSDDEDRLISSTELNDFAVALLLGRTRMQVARRRWRLRNPSNVVHRRWTPEEDAAIASASPTETNAELAARLGRSVAIVKRRKTALRRAGVPVAHGLTTNRQQGASA